MNYYLTKLTHKMKDISGTFEVLQLVRASNKELARDVVRRMALVELREEDIIGIRVNDTLFGE